jgi:hypothetical protein
VSLGQLGEFKALKVEILSEKWWFIGSETRLYINPAELGSNPAISPEYIGLPVLRLPSGMGLHCRLSSEGRQRIINTRKGFWSTKNHSGLFTLHKFQLFFCSASLFFRQA